jgi:hypothetical protein
MVKKTDTYSDQCFDLILSTYPALETILEDVYDSLGADLKVNVIEISFIRDEVWNKPGCDTGGSLDTIRYEIDSQFYAVGECSVYRLPPNCKVKKSVEGLDDLLRYVVEVLIVYDEWRGSWRNLDMRVFELDHP